MGGDEVDGVVGPPAVVREAIRRSGQPRTQFGQRTDGAPRVTDGAAIHVVPLRPRPGEVAGLIAADADVPGLGDQFDLRENRVGCHRGQHGRPGCDHGGCAGQGRGEVEPEAVDVQVRHPVPQRREDQLDHARGLRANGVPAPCRVVVHAPVEHPVGVGVGRALPRQGRTEVVALRGVVVDHVDDDLEAGGVQGVHHVAELGDLFAALSMRRIGGVRSEVAHGVVSPVVGEAAAEQHRLGHEVLDGQQFDGRHAQVDQIVDHRLLGHARIGSAQFLGNARVQLREALDVRLVDDRAVPGDPRRPVLRRRQRGCVDAVRDEGRRVGVIDEFWILHLVGVDGVVDRQFAGHGQCVGVQQQFRGVEPKPVLRLPWPAHAESVGGSHGRLFDLRGPVAVGSGAQVEPGVRFEEFDHDPLGCGGEVVDGGHARVVRIRSKAHRRQTLRRAHVPPVGGPLDGEAHPLRLACRGRRRRPVWTKQVRAARSS